jgi:hypothetical protein
MGPVSDLGSGKVYTLADASTGTPISGGAIDDATKTKYVGLQWCFGKMTINETNHTIACDGSGEDNSTQGDSVSADITFDIIQSRNNPDFRCGNAVNDYVNFGDTASESTHNLGGWSDAWVKPGWGGNYGGGSNDNTLRLLMGKGDVNGCADPAARPATFTMNAGTGSATKLTLEHLDGAVNDSFEVFVNGNSAGTYLATSSGGNEIWKTTVFTFPGVTGVVNVELRATHPVAAWCADWGQVAFSNARLE